MDREPDLTAIGNLLADSGFWISTATTAKEALSIAERDAPNLALADIGLPSTGGLDLCSWLKGTPATRRMPLLALSAKAEEADVVAALELGADDYITKPFRPAILIARTRAALRRQMERGTEWGRSITIHNMVIYPGRFMVFVGGRLVPLTFSEFQMLHLLAKMPGWTFSRSEITAVKGVTTSASERSVDACIFSLRRKLGQLGACLETVRGIGYRLSDHPRKKTSSPTGIGASIRP